MSINDGRKDAVLGITAKDRLDRVRSLLEARASSQHTQFPLSNGQQAIWLTYLHSPNSPAYNVSFSARVISGLDVQALERALETLVDRHPSLRSTFRLIRDQPVQIVHERQSFRLDHQDWAHLDQEAFRRAVRRSYEAPFDLEGGPVFRAHLLRDADGIVLLLVMHHVVADAWSLLLILNELELLYLRETTGARVLPDSPILVFADHVMLEKEYLSGDMAEKDWEYWRSNLAAPLSTLDLPLDRQRPGVRTENGASYYFKIDRVATAALRKLSSAEGATLYMALLAAFKVLLSRYSGQEDIIVGSTTVGRVKEFEDIVGYFANPVALRSDLSGDPSFGSFLGRVKQTVTRAITHSRLPFPVVLDKLTLRRDPSRTAVFQVMFNMLKPRREGGIEELMMPGREGYRLNWAGLVLEHYDVAQLEGQFDLTFNFVEGKEEVFGNIKYNTDLYDRDRIQRMAGHYRALLSGIVADPGCPVTKLPLMSDSEAIHVLDEWNQTDVGIPDGCIHQLFEINAGKNPEQLAVVLPDEAISYGELNRRANLLANRLLAKRLKPEDTVGIFIDRSTELVVAILAVLKSGGAYIPLDPIQPPERLVAMLEQAEARFLLAAGKALPGLENKNVEVIDLKSEHKTCELPDNQNPGVELAGQSAAYILFTSGSTGKPKGVVVEHRNVINHVSGILQNLALKPGFSFASLTSVAADLGNTAIFTSLCGGGTLYLAAPYTIGDLDSVWRFISEKTVDCFKITPSFLSALMMAGGKDARSLLPQRHLLIGGEALNWSLLESLWALSPRCSIHNHYGPTETTIGVSMNLIAPAPPEKRPANPPIGRPMANCRLYVLDSHLQPLPVGVPGELFIGGKSVARGYLNLPEETLSRFTLDPFDKRPGAKMYRTGDRVQWLSDGKVQFLNRVDDQVKIRGYRVEPAGVRAVLAGFAGVRDAVVLARKDPNGEERLVAYLVPESDRHLDIQGIRAYLKQKLPEYMIPTAFVEMDKLPFNQLGKLDREALPAPERSSYMVEAEHVPPKTPTEQNLASIWSEVLSVPRISVHDNFFNIGGNSLSAIRILARIRDRFEVSISVVDLFEAPTIAGAASIIETCTSVIEFMKIGPAEPDREREEIEV